MEELFKQAQLASNSSPINQKELLLSHIDEIFQIIFMDHDKNIMAAATRGSKLAILAVYKTDAKHRDKIPIHDLLFPPPHLNQTYNNFSIQPLLNQLEEKFKPFRLSIMPAAYILTPSTQSTQPADSTQPVELNYPNIKAVIVEWDL
jgi:hypothetical protein